MEFGQLLAGERRTKVGIVIADVAQSKFSKARNKLAITEQSMAAVRQCQRPRLAITYKQTPAVAIRETKSL